MFHITNKSALIVEDDILLSGYCQNILKLNGWEVETVRTGEEGLKQIHNTPPQVVLLDIFLPDSNGLDILLTIQKEMIDTTVVIMTGKGSVDLAVEAMRCGAFDFFEKPVEPERFLATMNNAIRHQKACQIIKEYENNSKRDRLQKLIGASLPMQTLFRIIDNVSTSRATVFLLGESGTGKELCAEAIHQQSSRKNRPFIILNCAAIPHDLMESEIFGHKKGAFSDAQHFRQGAASLAHGGTLFLDEICEMELGLQSKLLRFIQSGRIKKVGGDQEESVDIRFICATNKDPHEEVKRGRFREDLLYRLLVVPITVPPLRERGDDILLLAHHFLTRYAKEENKAFTTFSTEAASALLQYEWPGNVREMQNVIQQSVVLHNGKKVTKEILPSPLDQIETRPHHFIPPTLSTDHSHMSAVEGQQPTPIIPLAQVEMEAIERAIKQCEGNVRLAADLLEIDQSTIYRKRKKWGQREESNTPE
ncbi:MAG: sigma-54-dependent Fis family transcriptional regulator [Magnetococcales bacterium]|nr:sigma-54-dependent Fis family transcriptional regulator [Magnetococcales bacterium]